jgi:hypothetical protein
MTPIPEHLEKKLKGQREEERKKGYNAGIAFVEKHGYSVVSEILNHDEREDQMKALAEYGVSEQSKAHIEGFFDALEEAEKAAEPE